MASKYLPLAHQKTPSKILLALLFGITTLLVACSANNKSISSIDTQHVSNEDLSLIEKAHKITSQEDCEENNGTWKKVGKLQAYSCILPTTDAGKSCTDSSQCQTGCITKEDVTPGTEIVGQCHDSTHQFGCRTYVKNGKVEGTLCVD